MRLRLRMLGALLLGGAAALLVSCGNSNGLLSSSDGSKLSGDLDGVSSAVSARNCGAAGQQAGKFTDDVAALPGTVDKRLLNALGDAARKVSSQATRACTLPTTTQQTLSTQTQTTTTAPPTNTTPTNTVPPVNTTTIPPPTQETTPPPTGTSPNGGAGTGSGGGAPGNG